MKAVQSFLGLDGFFRKFVPRFAWIARPLTELTKKETPFAFGTPERESFERLKDSLCSAPVLQVYNPALETELHTDASKYGYGVCLLQKLDGGFHPVFYLSRKTTPAEEKYSIYELEVLAVVYELKKLRVYLLGLQFKIVTDCKAFQLTMNKLDMCARVAR